MPRRHGHNRARVRIAIVAAAVVFAVLPLPARPIERWYSRGFYLLLQSAITPLSNSLPIALLDVAAAGVILTAIARARRRIRGGSSTIALRSAVSGIVVFIAGSYLVFLCLWGLNYRRVPLEQKLDFDRARVTKDAALELGTEAVRRVNQARPLIGDDTLDPQSLATAFVEAQRALGSHRTAAIGRPKRSLLSLYFRWAAIDGMTDPFFLEIIVNPDVLRIEQPFVIAHEWSHLAGYADESEANFVAWLACIRGDQLARYSGWLALYGHLAGALPSHDRRMLYASLDPDPRADLAAIAARYERSAPIVRQAAREVYDSYLKANRVAEGIASYDAVVRLAVGTTFDEGWIPRLRR